MKTILIALAVKLILAAIPGSKPLPLTHPIMIRASSAADDLITATTLEAETSPALVRATYVWSYFEASWWTAPKGLNDKGSACGVMQVHVDSGILPPEWTCAMLRTDRVLGYRAGLRVLRTLVNKCGSLKGGLTAFSMRGECPGDWTIQLVRDRCAVAGC